MRLTARALAEMLRRPNVRRTKLKQQKYPDQEPQRFQVPYYSPALRAIRKYYESGNDRSVLNAEIVKVQRISLTSRRDHNARVLDAFRKHPVSRRKFKVNKNSKVATKLGPLELRMSPDLRVEEEDVERVLFFHWKAQQLDTEEARYTIEIAHWVAERTRLEIPISRFEYVDLFTGTVFKIRRRRDETIGAVESAVPDLNNLWQSL